MSWWKNGMLLAAGGVTGLALAAWLESENEHYEDPEERDKRKSKAYSVGLLENKVRQEAEWALAECTTDEEREEVYAEVTASIQKLQAVLQKRGEKIIAEIKEQASKDDADDEFEDNGARAVRKFKSSMEDLTKSLDDTLSSLKPAPTPAV